MPTDAWDPITYERFKDERSRPFFDLIDLVDGPVDRLVDLGCGTGELTRRAVERLGATRAFGIDNSPSMLARAGAFAVPERLTFGLGDLAEWTSEADVDLVVANASLQWVPAHREVLARWASGLAPGGQIAVQVPANADAPAHAVARTVALEEPFVSWFGPDGPPADPVAANVLDPVAYSEALFDLGFVDQSVRLQVYPHVLESTAAVVDWVRGTMLTRFEAVLDPSQFDAFVARYRQRLLEVLGNRAPYLFAFKRILIWGRLAR